MQLAWAHTFTTTEWETVRASLRSCEYLARDEEKLWAGRKHAGCGCEECTLADAYRAEAARRAMKYSILADRIAPAPDGE